MPLTVPLIGNRSDTRLVVGDNKRPKGYTTDQLVCSSLNPLQVMMECCSRSSSWLPVDIHGLP